MNPRPENARRRAIRGDFQTPPALARAVIETLLARGEIPRSPAVVLEPTCGVGAFLVAAQKFLPSARLCGFDVDQAHVEHARVALGAATAGLEQVKVGDFFQIDWGAVIAALPEPIVVLGNPPWVTSATLGALGGDNRPEKRNDIGLRGLAARTGRSNFDIAEWMIVRLLRALEGRRAVLAMLCKTSVARRVIDTLERERLPWGPGGLRAIDAHAHFGAEADAALLVIAARPVHERAQWPVFPDLPAETPTSHVAHVEGTLVADLERFERTRSLIGVSRPEWRSGIKHDAASVMELRLEEGILRDAAGTLLDLEPEVVFPLLKAGDLVNGLAEAPRRALLVPQRSLKDDPSHLKHRAPRAFAYLEANAERLAARKSSIYRARPRFSIFGVGSYAFAPYKVAISGLHKHLRPVVVPPFEGRPVVFDDTCYFLPFDDHASALRAHAALDSPQARDFLLARIFWDAKRPVQKGVLQSLDLEKITTP